MRADELRAMTDAELRQTLDDLRQEQFNLRFQQATQQIENTSRIKQVRKDIARAMTILRERELMSEVE